MLEVGSGVAMVMAKQEAELVWDQHLLQPRVLEVGKGVVVVKARQDVEWRAWGTLELTQDTDWRMIH